MAEADTQPEESGGVQLAQVDPACDDGANDARDSNPRASEDEGAALLAEIQKIQVGRKPESDVDLAKSDPGNTYGGGYNCDLSHVSMHEPRPGEKTYAESGKSNKDARPPMDKLRGLKSLPAVDYLPPDENEQSAISVEEKPDDEQIPAPQKGCCGGSKSSQPAAPVKFGVWDGVFARCLSNIFGVIMFLRVPWLIGYAGLWMYLVVLLFSVIITTLTTLSLSAVATNGVVKGGGAYFLISRSLGPAFGGSIGVVFYLANAVAVAMYLLGFGEALLNVLKPQFGEVLMVEGWDLRIISVVTLLVCLFLCITSLKLVSKLQLFLLGAVILAVLAFFIGCFMEHAEYAGFAPYKDYGIDYATQNLVADFGRTNIQNRTLVCPHPTLPNEKGEMSATETLQDIDGDVNFGTALSVFFPAVTGIMAGANISGDLKDPSAAIPFGTLLSIFISTIVYVLLGIAVSMIGVRSIPGIDGGCGFEGLFHDSTYMATVALHPAIVFAGIFLCTLNAGIATLVGAPRILQALSVDNISPKTKKLFANEAKSPGAPEGEPVAAYMLTFVISGGCILVGNLNAIAPLITNFFMISYALTNFACFMADASKTPGWRPTFRYFNKYLSLLGAILCIGLMLYLDLVMGLISCVIAGGLYLFVWKLDPQVNWGSATEGYQYTVAMRAQTKLTQTKDHVKNWRPQVLALLPFNPEEAVPTVKRIRRMTVEDREEHYEKKKKELPTSAMNQNAVTCSLALLLRDLKKGQGINMAGHVRVIEQALRPDLKQHNDDEEDKMEDVNPFTLTTSCRKLLQETLRELHVQAFAEVVTANDLRDGARSLMEISGMGKMRPNTIALGFPERWAEQSDEELKSFVGIIGDAFDCKYGVCLLRSNGKSYAQVCEQENKGNIDVWWMSDDGGLTMLLPHLIRKSRAWRNSTSTIRVMNPMNDHQLAQSAAEMTRLKSLLTKFRIVADTPNVVFENSDSPSEQGVKKFLNDAKLTEEELTDASRKKIRMGEFIAEEARKEESKTDATSLVVLSIPVPQRYKQTDIEYVRLYMAWLDALSVCSTHCPVLMVHGNQEDALTFYT